MDQQIDTYELHSVWRALAGVKEGEGWRTIPIEMKGNCRILAGRIFPGDQEAILVGFQSISMPSERGLPQGHGFSVSKLKKNILEDGNVWLSLARLPTGSLDMFTLMSEDLLSFLSFNASKSEDSLLHAFLTRIRAWQNFMDSVNANVLSPEEEIGLFGELLIIEKLIERNIPCIDAVNSWCGPVDGIHDFLVGSGALEVKATVSSTTFKAKISSLEQLDNSITKPLFLVGVRLDLTESGYTLPEMANKVKNLLSGHSGSLAAYETKLAHAGLVETHSNNYTRKFSCKNILTFLVDNNFPKLTQNNVSIEIQKAVYEIDLNLIHKNDFDLNNAIDTLRGI